MPARNRKRTKVFISYCHQDKAWLERLRIHLRPLEREMEIDIWDDSKIKPGTKWKDEITNVINSTKVAVLLVSADFLASDFIATDEVPPLLTAAKEDGAVIIPLILSPSRFTKTKGIADFQAINDPKHPLLKMPFVQQEEVLVELAEAIVGSFSHHAPDEPAGPPSKVSPAHEQKAGKVTKSPQEIPQLSALITEIRAQLLETFREQDAAETGAQIAGTVLVGGLQAIARRSHPKQLASDLLQSLEVASAQIFERSKPVKGDMMSQLLLHHSRDEQVAGLLSEAIDKVGKDGSIVVERGLSGFDVDIVEGMQFDRGYLSPEFITNQEKNRVEISNPRILFANKKIESASELVLTINKPTSDKEPLVVIAEDVEDAVLSLLIGNRNLATLAVKAPGFGDRRGAMLEDMAILTGGTVVSSSRFSLLTLPKLGKADRVISDAENTIIVGAKGSVSNIEARVREIREAIEETTSDYDREKLQERLAKLIGGVAIIRVGGRNEQERHMKIDLVERSLKVFRAAVEEGVVPGEHLALVNAATHLRGLSPAGEEQVANLILAAALETPLQRMAEGLGRSAEETLLTIRSTQKQKRNRNIGYYSDQNSFVDLVKAGVIVPTQTVVVLVKAAVGLASEKLAAARYTDDVVRQLSSS